MSYETIDFEMNFRSTKESQMSLQKHQNPQEEAQSTIAALSEPEVLCLIDLFKSRSVKHSDS